MFVKGLGFVVGWDGGGGLEGMFGGVGGFFWE